MIWNSPDIKPTVGTRIITINIKGTYVVRRVSAKYKPISVWAYVDELIKAAKRGEGIRKCQADYRERKRREYAVDRKGPRNIGDS